ncbi:hypothetical protein D910_02353 [Dendroctonus ponderosae]|uniref:Tetraspanin n=1 Tax=Dendroctonus ponderosae TaxID=77166 RepID=U4U4P4_DENPD|nr:hypothetical protein D910_02353 [Dendroctonus ponderosae]
MVDFQSIMRNYSRFLLIIFNFFFVLTGVIVISVGISTKAYFNEFDDLLNDKYFYISDVFIVVGVIIFFISFFGCCGAAKENACLTTTFSTLLIVIFILEALVGIGALKCCGVDSSGDWKNVSIPNRIVDSNLPLSCCNIAPGTVNPFTCNANSTDVHANGCLQVFGDYIRDNTSSIEIAALTLAVIQLLGIILSCYLAKQIRSDYETV